MSDDNPTFGPMAWTPARCVLWESLNTAERKELEDIVAKGSSVQIPAKFMAQYEAAKGKEKKVAISQDVLDCMRRIGWTDAVIESVYGPYSKEKSV
ncbi:hypothetical protein [Thalassospira mesophila]|uniref:Uncharacterized protein n=1 Tax=Thalassospira mesophila TaxID=1293891 RepID=A0A1Y2KYK8_9PROT|nr:hypothetical protein [Thalassospira mesophila]OSQ37216.1 hypothetical protein TMES_15515 [Thalassospira mesophila]